MKKAGEAAIVMKAAKIERLAVAAGGWLAYGLAVKLWPGWLWPGQLWRLLAAVRGGCLAWRSCLCVVV